MSWEKSVCAGSPMASGGSGHLSGSSLRRIFRSMISTSLLSFKACDQRSHESLCFSQVHGQSCSSREFCKLSNPVIYRSTYRVINIASHLNMAKRGFISSRMASSWIKYNPYSPFKLKPKPTAYIKQKQVNINPTKIDLSHVSLLEVLSKVLKASSSYQKKTCASSAKPSAAICVASAHILPRVVTALRSEVFICSLHCSLVREET